MPIAVAPSKMLFSKTLWRRGWDSNPRYGYRYNGFRDRSLKESHAPPFPRSGGVQEGVGSNWSWEGTALSRFRLLIYNALRDFRQRLVGSFFLVECFL